MPLKEKMFYRPIAGLLPNQIAIQANEKADKAAKRLITHETNIKIPYTHVRLTIHKYMKDKRQGDSCQGN